ncbi:MAG: TIGR00153 family protein [Gammaproteobacteria bacterium]|nr:MAG: TIGR00153 family protein [Gammaproteobacteria bacterium]
MITGSYLSKIFGNSPVHPLQQHMYKVYQCAKLLIPFFEAVAKEDLQEMSALQEQISKMESEADDLKRDLQMQLPKGLFMPVDRRDLLSILKTQDKIANRSKDISGLILGRKMKLPSPLGEKFVEYVTQSIEASKQALKTVNQLDELVETGFSGNEIKFVQERIVILEELESENDRKQVELRATLFEMESQLPPVDVMFMYRVIDWIGTLADLAQRVGHRLQLMLAK